MYTGQLSCPRCKGTAWHRDEKGCTSTGVYMTMMTCIICDERLLVRHVMDQPDVCLVCRRWTKCQLGKLAPRWVEWMGREPSVPPCYKGGK